MISCNQPDIFIRMQCSSVCGAATNLTSDVPVRSRASTLFGPRDADKRHAIGFAAWTHNLTQRCSSCIDHGDPGWASAAARMVDTCCSSTLGPCLRNITEHCSLLNASLSTLGASGMADVLAAMPQTACWQAPHTFGAWAAEHARSRALSPSDAIDVCLEQHDQVFRMACVHGAVYSAVSYEYRSLPDAARLWQHVAAALRVESFAGDAAMLAHIGHGVGHGVAMGAMARTWPGFSTCTPFTSVGVTDALHDEAAAVCDAAPTRQLAHLCAGGTHAPFEPSTGPQHEVHP